MLDMFFILLTRHEPNMFVSILTCHCLMPAFSFIRHLLLSVLAPLCSVLELDIVWMSRVSCTGTLKQSFQVTNEYFTSMHLYIFTSVHVAFPGAVVIDLMWNTGDLPTTLLTWILGLDLLWWRLLWWNILPLGLIKWHLEFAILDIIRFV